MPYAKGRWTGEDVARREWNRGGAAMPVVTQDKALELLTNEVEKFGADELLEVYNEVFPDDPYTLEEAREDATPLIKRLADRINSGLGIAEIIDLWAVICPRHRNVWYDEVEERIHYSEGAEAVSSE
jgi:hypothetical protein